MGRLDSTRENAISREFEEYMAKALPHARAAVRQANTPERLASLRDQYIQLYETAAMKIACKHLGHSRSGTSSGPTKSARRSGLLREWDVLYTEAQQWLANSSPGCTQPFPAELSQMASDMRAMKIPVPDNRPELLEWSRMKDHHRSIVGAASDDLFMTDRKALKHRKRFFKRATKQHETTTIRALRTSSGSLTTDAEEIKQLMTF